MARVSTSRTKVKRPAAPGLVQLHLPQTLLEARRVVVDIHEAHHHLSRSCRRGRIFTRPASIDQSTIVFQDSTLELFLSKMASYNPANTLTHASPASSVPLPTLTLKAAPVRGHHLDLVLRRGLPVQTADGRAYQASLGMKRKDGVPGQYRQK
ncbi:hypothetical protein E2C01_022771 [Portunus trituberculatus]|uniref:Uncharacterized protein n=1 Tax=Portunus trituberculatus TaxID=210409 RepID=A0A5B7E6A0_PORTR|nr:hypothetical protein [Portunus trituberculatus]